jgi:hypothetical protein
MEFHRVSNEKESEFKDNYICLPILKKRDRRVKLNSNKSNWFVFMSPNLKQIKSILFFEAKTKRNQINFLFLTKN